MLAAVLLYVLWERNGIERQVEGLRENASFVSLGERGRVRVRKGGTENPGLPIVFESGVGGTSAEWGWLQADLARDHPVLSYDRRGTGLSDDAVDGVDAITRVADLDAILDKSDLPPPYLFVGHGYGAVLLRLYQSAHPEKVAGIFMIEPLHPDDDVALVAANAGKTTRRAAHFASFGLSMFARAPKIAPGLPAAEADEMRLLRKYDRHLLGVAAEADTVKDALERVRGLPPMESVPLGVGSATSPLDETVTKALARHDEIARQSRRGFHAMIEGAGHDTILTHAAFVSQLAADIRNLETMIPRTDTTASPAP